MLTSFAGCDVVVTSFILNGLCNISTKLRTFVALVRQYGLRPLDVIDSVLLLLVVCLRVCRFRGSERAFSAKAHSQLCSY